MWVCQCSHGCSIQRPTKQRYLGFDLLDFGFCSKVLAFVSQCAHLSFESFCPVDFFRPFVTVAVLVETASLENYGIVGTSMGHFVFNGIWLTKKVNSLNANWNWYSMGGVT